MATAFNPQYVNLDRIEAAQIQRRANQQSPLDAALQGLQQGIQLQQLPQTIQDQQLQRQLQAAIAQQKLAALANPQQAIQQKIQADALDAILSGRNPNLVFEPQVSPELQAMRQTALDQAGVPPPTTDFRQVVPGINGLPAIGLSPSAGAKVLQDQMNREIQLANSRASNFAMTPEGYLLNKATRQLEQLNLPTDANVGLEDQRRLRAEADAKAKADAAQALLEKKQDFTGSENERNRDLRRDLNSDNNKNKETLSQLRAKQSGIKLNEVDKKIVEKFGTENASKISILNQLLAGVDTFLDPKISDEIKVVEGQRLGKILNSTEGKDALQDAERTALLPFLNFEKGNLMSLFDPTRKVFGRNLDAFQRQLEAAAQSVNRSVDYNNKYINSIYEKNGGSYTPDSAIDISRGNNTPEAIGKLLQSGQINKEEALTRFRALKAK